MATEVTLDAATEGLVAGLRGTALRPGDEGYDDARAVWNGLIDRQPALIVQCTGAADVVDAVNFAREQGLAALDQGRRAQRRRQRGQRRRASSSTCRRCAASTSTRRPRPCARRAARRGATLDRETQLFGLAVPGGVVSTTGIAGLTLHGGIGHLRRKYGLSIDNLLSVDIVTADGQAAHRERDRERGPLLGRPRRRQQLRRRDLVRVPGAPGRADGHGRRDLLPARGGAALILRLARLHGDGARRAQLARASSGASPPASRSRRSTTASPCSSSPASTAGAVEDGEPRRAAAARARRAADRPERAVAVARTAERLRRALPARASSATGSRARSRELSDAAIDDDRRVRRPPADASSPTSSIWHHGGAMSRVGESDTAYARPRRRLPRHRRGELDRPGADRRGDRLGPRVLGRAGAVLDRRGLPQLPGLRRGAGGARAGRLRRELRAARRAEGEVRPRQPVPDEPQHRAGRLALSLRRACAGRSPAAPKNRHGFGADALRSGGSLDAGGGWKVGTPP